jgi:hypothetical protein
MCLIDLITGVASSFDSCNQILPTPQQVPFCVDLREMVIGNLTFKGDYKFLTVCFLKSQSNSRQSAPPNFPDKSPYKTNQRDYPPSPLLRRLAKIKAYPHPHAEQGFIAIARGADEELP